MLLLSPVVNDATPVSGLTTGGTQVTITGSNFIEHSDGPGHGHSRVSGRQGRGALSTIVSDTKLIATTPPVASAGPVSITVSQKHLNPALAGRDARRPVHLQVAEAAPGDRPDAGVRPQHHAVDTMSQTCDLGGYGCAREAPSTGIQAYVPRLRNLLRARYRSRRTSTWSTPAFQVNAFRLSGRQSGGGNSGARRLLDCFFHSGDAKRPRRHPRRRLRTQPRRGRSRRSSTGCGQMVESAKSQGKKVILLSLTPVKAPLDNTQYGDRVLEGRSVQRWRI